jgi:hypothetical protein
MIMPGRPPKGIILPQFYTEDFYPFLLKQEEELDLDHSYRIPCQSCGRSVRNIHTGKAYKRFVPTDSRRSPNSCR